MRLVALSMVVLPLLLACDSPYDATAGTRLRATLVRDAETRDYTGDAVFGTRDVTRPLVPDRFALRSIGTGASRGDQLLLYRAGSTEIPGPGTHEIGGELQISLELEDGARRYSATSGTLVVTAAGEDELVGRLDFVAALACVGGACGGVDPTGEWTLDVSGDFVAARGRRGGATVY